MGYQKPVRSRTLYFEDGEYEGLELEVRTNVGLDYLLDTMSWQGLLEQDPDPLEVQRKSQEWAASALLSWNLEDGAGQPVPPTPEEFTRQFEPYAIGLVIGKWIEAMGTVPAPLAKRSGVGRTSGTRKQRRSRQS